MPDLLAMIAALRSSVGRGAIIRRRVDPSSPVDVFVGIEPSTGHIGVLLRLHRRLIPPERDYPGGAGFAIQIHAIAEDVKDFINLGSSVPTRPARTYFCTLWKTLFRVFLKRVDPKKPCGFSCACVAVAAFLRSGAGRPPLGGCASGSVRGTTCAPRSYHPRYQSWYRCGCLERARR